MSGHRLAALLLILAAAAPPVLAETYKWVDRNGTVNYSNKPPPENAAKAQRVEERISVVAADWQRRRQFLLAAQPGIPADYATGYGPVAVFYDPYSYGGAVFRAGLR